jgi:Ca2+-binding RTX toxin-like protein
LIGGTGADRIVGNADDDILIAGMTLHDAVAIALCAIMDEWTRDDRTYEQRITNLTDGGGLNGTVKLVNSGENRTVFDDSSNDVLTGSSGLDWFFFDPDRDRATDLNDEIFANDLAFFLE